MREHLLLIGAGGHARSCIDVIEQNGKYEILGLIGLPTEVSSRLFGYEVIATDTSLKSFLVKVKYAVVGLGQIKSGDSRIRIYKTLKDLGFILPIIISPRAYVSRHARIGEGSVVMHDALVNAGSQIGVNCIINSKSLIEHDAIIGNHCHISTGSIVNGGTVVGDGCFIGSNAMIGNNISVADGNLVGGGGVLLRTINKISTSAT